MGNSKQCNQGNRTVINTGNLSGQYLRNKGSAVFRGSIIVSILSLSACGGGSADGVSIPIDGGSGFQTGVFMDSGTYFARCQAPRGGINPATNQSYPDVQGTTTDENNFLRS